MGCHPPVFLGRLQSLGQRILTLLLALLHPLLGDPEPLSLGLCSALVTSEERAQSSSLVGSLSALGGNLVCVVLSMGCPLIPAILVSENSLLHQLVCPVLLLLWCLGIVLDECWLSGPLVLAPLTSI